MDINKYLRIYLRDHLAASIAGLDLAKRTLKSNEGTRFEAELRSVVEGIERDKKTLQDFMTTVGVGEDRLKGTLAWAAEKAGRLKLNGEITSYSPLSRVVELEALLSGIRGKKALWESLRAWGGRSPLDIARLDELIPAAESQIETVAKLHEDAAKIAFGEAAG